ncbi:hypothetical protein Tco_1243703 [Tanacetum coccineum]
MEAAVNQCSADKNDFEIKIKQLQIDNDQLLNQIMSQEIMHMAVNFIDIVDVNMSCVDECNKCLELETKLSKEKFSFKSSVENLDLNARLEEKVFAIAALKNELRKLKGKNVVDYVVSKPTATIIAPGMYKLDIEPISHRLKNNKDAHKDYLKKTIENTDTMRGLVERARTQNPSEPLLDSACRFTKHVQELLVYVFKTCPNSPKPSEKLVAVTPLNKDKRVRFAEPSKSSSNTKKQIDSHITQDSNKPLLHSIGVNCSTSASGSKPSGNTKNNRTSQPSCSNKTNKVEDQSRSVKS